MITTKHYKGYVTIPFDEYAADDGFLKDNLIEQYGCDIEIEILEEDIVPRDEWLADEINDRRKDESV